MNQRRVSNWILSLLSVALLFATVFGDGGNHHVHHTAVENDDGSTSEAISSTATKSGSNSLPDFLKGLNLKQFAVKENDQATAPSSQVTSATSTAINNGAKNIPLPPGYNYPGPPPSGGYPGFPWGVGGGKHFGVDISGGFFGGLTPYFPIIEKVILVIGAGLLLLVILALLKGALATGGFLNSLGSSLSNAVSGAGAFDFGPFHASAAGSAATAANVNDPNFNRKVMDGVERRF